MEFPVSFCTPPLCLLSVKKQSWSNLRMEKIKIVWGLKEIKQWMACYSTWLGSDCSMQRAVQKIWVNHEHHISNKYARYWSCSSHIVGLCFRYWLVLVLKWTHLIQDLSWSISDFQSFCSIMDTYQVNVDQLFYKKVFLIYCNKYVANKYNCYK